MASLRFLPSLTETTAESAKVFFSSSLSKLFPDLVTLESKTTFKYLQRVESNTITHLIALPDVYTNCRNPSIYPDSQLYAGLKKLGTKDLNITLYLQNNTQALSAAQTVSKVFTPYTQKSSAKPYTVYVTFLVEDESKVDYQWLSNVLEGTRLAQRLVDTPPNLLNTATYLEEVKRVTSELGTDLKIIQGEDLKNQGFGGLWGVGKAAEHLPALAIMSKTIPGATKTLCLVGKGIVYDSGGLSIKIQGNMCGMKTDMGGSAAVIGAFQSAVKNGAKCNLHALLCLAENSVDSRSTRNDDILDMYSGKTVEINNTDAEGRLVLADGVAYATKHLNPDVIIDIATLTGAQLITTGKKYAAILCNDESLETTLVETGRQSGNLLFPILYAPEACHDEFKLFDSKVADMKNSVKDRANAQCAAAGHFVEQHLVGDKWDWKYHVENKSTAATGKGLWAHCDIAGTVSDDSNVATGYGVALLSEFACKL